MLGVDAVHSWDLPSEDYGTAQPPPASAGPRVAFAYRLDSGCVHDQQPIDCAWLWCGSSGGCVRCAITQSAQIAQIDIMLGYRHPLPSGICREPEDRNGVAQESVIYFLVDKLLIH